MPNVAGSARARLPPGRARAPSRVPRGVREVHTASFPPVPLGGHAPKAPTASRVVIGRESLRRQKVAAPDCAARAAPSRSIKLRTRNHHQRETVCLCEMLRNPHCHAREASAPHAHRRHDDHPVLRGPPGYGGPAGVLRACPHRTRAPRRASSSRTFSVHAACEASSPSRPTFVRTPRAPRPHALTRRPRVPLTANAGPTHVQDRPDPDGARATRPDHPRPSLSVRRPRSRTRCQSGENVRLDQSGFSGKRKPPPENIRHALSSTFAR